MHTHRIRGGLVLSALLAVLIAAGCGTPRKGLASNGSDCGGKQDYSGRSLPYHTIPIDNGNDFNASREAFQTSTDAQSGYTAYATWDPCALYLGLTGSAVGSGDCTDLSGPTCTVADLPESPERHLLFYLNTDPLGDRGTERARDYGDQQWRLPFKADYLLAVRSDGRSTPRGDSVVYVGNWHLYEAGEGGWTPMRNADVKIGDNSSSNFIEMRLPLDAIGSPCAVEVAGWVTDTRHGESFAYWPARNGSSEDSAQSGSGGGDGSRGESTSARPQSSSAADDPASASTRRLRDVGSSAADASRSDSSSRDSSSRSNSSRSASSDSTASGSAASRPSRADSAASRRSADSARAQGSSRMAARDSGGSGSGADSPSRWGGGESGPRKLEHYYGFELRQDVVPSMSANLDRTTYNKVGECAGQPSN